MDKAFLLETERFLHGQIPLSAAMEARVASYDESGIVLTAPLGANHNHLGTAFGGSLAAVATLAGYALLWLELDDRESHIVIRSSSISYHRPVAGEIRAVCPRLKPEELAVFKAKFAKTGKARISLKVAIEYGGRVCVEFEGVFVAVR